MAQPTFYLLHGPDDFASAEFLTGLKNQLGDPTMVSLNTTVFDSKSASLPEIASACATLPFLTERRLVIVEGWLTKLLSKTEDEDEASADDTPSTAKQTLKDLGEYLPEVPPTTALVLVERRALPETNALLKLALKNDWALVKFFDLPKGDALAGWIRQRAKTEHGDLTREAALALANLETDPRALGNEITKLLTYVDYARPVELEDVETLTPAGGEAKIFDMVDSIGQRKGPQAMRELHKLLDKEDPLYVLGMIVRQFRLILQAKEMLDARHAEGEVARALNLHPYPAGKICAQSRNFALTDLERIYRRLLEYDAEIKTGQIEAGAALDALVTSLTGRQ